MKHFPLFCVVALLGAAVSAPAQISIEGRIGRNVRGSVSVDFGGHHDRRWHAEPERRCPVVAPVRGHWETVYDQVLVPGYWREEQVPPTYGWVRGYRGRIVWGMIDPGGCRRVWVPEHFEQTSRRVWVGC